ncbi:MAG: FHA domain-containing protein [Cyanobacteria bacterium P01_H01_bin.15]
MTTHSLVQNTVGRALEALDRNEALLVVSYDGQNYPYSLKCPRVRIGRRHDNEIVIPDKTISKYHASICQVIDGSLPRFQIIDGPSVGGRSSSNGTFVNRIRVQGTLDIKDGDLIKFGPSVRAIFFCNSFSGDRWHGIKRCYNISDAVDISGDKVLVPPPPGNYDDDEPTSKPNLPDAIDHFFP